MMFELEYITDKNGQLKAIVVPVDLWNKLFIEPDDSLETISAAIENYALSKAMDEAQESPLLNREEALTFLDSQQSSL